jgi:cysteinyl-tRNA synthetase
MHNGFLQVEGEKMAKSAGNFVTVHELLKDWPGEVIRLNMLRTHYRQPIDWTVRGLEESWKMLSSWTAFPEFLEGVDEAYAPKVFDALCDDLNTPQAISELHVLDSKGDFGRLGPTLRALGFHRRPESKRAVDSAKVEEFIDARNAARAAKDFKEADRIRGELEAMGITLKDAKDPNTGELTTTWEVAR